jgi:hypothetical protein
VVSVRILIGRTITLIFRRVPKELTGYLTDVNNTGVNFL